MSEEHSKYRFTSFKKLLIFGTKLSGKTTLSKSFDEKEFSKKKEIENEKGKIIYINL